MNFLLERLQHRYRRVSIRQPVSGFTLLELMVVIACIAILAAVGTPLVSNYLRDAGLKQAVYQLSGDLFRIKSQAIRTNSTQSINFSWANNT
jgi:prepilin-type N-terminal cleavage/methylation domain-containing protein